MCCGWSNDNSDSSRFLKELREKGEVKFTPEDTDADRTLKAEWLRQLVRDGVVNRAVRINYAIIDGNFDLSYTTFKSPFVITESVFQGEVNLSFTKFECGINLSACHFTKQVSFHAAHIDGDFRISLARFHDTADFEDLHAQEIFDAEGANFKQAAFNRSVFSKSALFCCALLATGELVQTNFRGEVDFSDADFNGPTFFKGARFHDKATFDRIRINSSAFFSGDTPSDIYVKHKRHALNSLRPAVEPKEIALLEFKKGVSFIGAHIDSSISFAGARFHARADFRRLQVKGSALFEPFQTEDGSVFEIVRFQEECLFWNADIRGAMNFNAAQFLKGANFEHIRIGGRAFFRPMKHGGEFHLMYSGGEIVFQDARINGSVEFHGAHFGGKVKFKQAHIGGSVYFSERKDEGQFPFAQFDDEVQFSDAVIKGSIECRGGQFRGDVIFARSEIGGIADFSPVEQGDFLLPTFFGKKAIFLDAYIRGTVNFEGAFFKGEAVFERLKTDGTVFFRAAEHPDYADAEPEQKEKNGQLLSVVFCDVTSFMSARISGNAEFDGVQALREITFEQAGIGGDAYFRPWEVGATPVHFHDEVKFLMTDIKGTAEFSGTIFDGTADFTGAKIGGYAYFDGRHHYGEKDVSFEQESNVIAPVIFNGYVKFTGAHFLNQVSFERAKFKRKVDFTGVRSVGRASFKGSTLESQSIFEDARFTSLLFDRPGVVRTGWTKSFLKWLKDLTKDGAEIQAEPAKPSQFGGWVNLRGCTYDRIDGKLEHLVDWMEPTQEMQEPQLPYDRQPYTQLIKTLRAGGDEQRANFVYLRQRRLERRNTWERARKDFKDTLIWRGTLSGANYLIDWLFWHIGNYGVQPERLFFISLFFIIIGTRIFSLPNAVTVKSAEREPPTAAVVVPNKANPEAWDVEVSQKQQQEDLDWVDASKFSFSQFIPIVDIPSGSKWRPNDRGSFVFLGLRIPTDVYGSIHRVAGAILVPLLVAALAAALYRRLRTEL